MSEKKLTKKVIRQTAKGTDIIQSAGDIVIQSEDIQAIFEEAVALINKGEARAAQVHLEGLWKRHNDKMTPRQKSNCKRLIGCSLDGQDMPEQAGKFFLEAKDYDPQWEKARAFESLAYLCLGRPSKAHELAEAVLKDFSQNNVAWLVWIQTENKFNINEILQKVPSQLHGDVEVAMALAVKALSEKKYDLAEKYLQAALKEVPGNPRIAEKMAYILLGRSNINEIFLYQRKPNQREILFLTKAVELLTEAIDKFQKESKIYSAAYALIKRAAAYKALSKNKAARDDLEQAYKLAKDNPETVYWHSIELAQDNLDEAIDHLKAITNTSEQCDIEFVLAQMLKQRNSSTDLRDAIKILESKIKYLVKMPCDFRTDYLSLFFQIRSEIEGLEQINQDFEGITSDVIDESSKNILYAEVLWFCKDIPSSIKKAKQCLGALDENSSVHDRRRLAMLMKNLGLHKDALHIWKSIVTPQYIGQDTYNLLECAERCEDAKFVIEFSKELYSNGIWDRRIFELELYYHELFNDNEGAIALLQEYLKNPKEESYTPYIRTRLSLIGIRIDRYDLIEKDPSKLPKVIEVNNARTGRLVVNVLRYGGNHPEALEYAYNLLRLNWDNSEAHLAMIELLLPIGPKITLVQTEIVEPSMAVFYKEDDTNVSRWHILENSSIGTPIQSHNEYDMNHPISQAMLGKKKGDSFFLKKDGFQERTATIQEIRSKYVYRFNECFENFESQFPGNDAIRKFIAIDKTGKFDISPMQKLAEKDAKYVKQLEEVYSTQLVPIYWMAIKKGRSIVETMNYVAANPNLKFKCCIGNDQEEIKAEEGMSNVKEIVLDASSIVTLMFTSSYEHILKLPCKFIVSQGTLNAFRQVECLRGDPESIAGSYSINGFQLITSDDVMKARGNLEKLIKFIETNCTIIDGLVVAELEKERRDVSINILGRDCLESILLATQANRILWTDDLATAVLAQNEFGCYRIWTQFFFNHLLEEGLLDNNIVQNITVLLMQMEYYYTKPTVDTFMMAIEKSNNNVDCTPAFQVFNWFNNPSVKVQGQFYIAANVIKRIWQEINIASIAQQTTIRILERLIQRPNGYLAIEGLRDYLGGLFGVDVINAQKAKKTIVGWLSSIQGNRIILP
jgi:tetratricopeptide (TPR) repeat protein